MFGWRKEGTTRDDQHLSPWAPRLKTLPEFVFFTLINKTEPNPFLPHPDNSAQQMPTYSSSL